MTATQVDFTKGLVPAIIRDSCNGMILMLAYMNEDAYRLTVETGETWFWSRSRNELWNKGATSGNRQRVVGIAMDCDCDALIVSVVPAGPACHTGAQSCFAELPPPALDLDRLMQVLRDRREKRPEGSYSAYLFNEGTDKILKKIGEEATEVVIAGKGSSKERLVSEVTDLVFHLAILMTEAGLEWGDVGDELRKRER